MVSSVVAVALADTLSAPMVVLFAFVFLRERIQWNDYAGLLWSAGASC